MSLDKQPDQTSLSFKDLDTEANAVQLKNAESMELSTLSSLNFGGLNILEQSLNHAKDSLSKGPELKRRNGSMKDETEKEIPIISLNEVSWHDTVDDCWLVICDYVYNCTDFIHKHPGSQDVMLEYAGRDATLAFVGTGHSEYGKRLLQKLLIGELPLSERIFRTKNGIKIVDCI
ncbi:PREDICTED: cytochrome b5 [Ceratosolen solmsi marchali]|uniref:Cytochrome b5 n=1 Tax=Ceratosolen solmsi marchali TaxID=326594 RepID=A0AAJ6YP56_9HYME|nr:PREDICTED: cytochrome b5 [Ceratosolen solmsi marchali]